MNGRAVVVIPAKAGTQLHGHHRRTKSGPGLRRGDKEVARA
jgi:hypothetical protein